MHHRVMEIRGIIPQHARLLNRQNIKYAEQLLTMDISIMSKLTQIPPKKLHQYQNSMKLMQIPNIGPKYAYFLQRDDINITSIEALSQTTAEDLATKMIQSNRHHRFLKLIPTVTELHQWIKDAKRV